MLENEIEFVKRGPCEDCEKFTEEGNKTREAL